MDRKKQDDYHFVKEHIKKKPEDKRRFFVSPVHIVISGIVFGVLAALAFCASKPVFDNLFGSQEQKVQLSGSEDSVSAEPEPETKSEQVYITEKQQMELEDYQILQNKLYSVGKEANKSVVSVTGVTSRKDWFDSDYETQGQGAGIIIADTSQKFLIVTEKKLIADATQIEVSFYDSASAEANLVAYDGNTGIAVLSVDKKLLNETTKQKVTPAEIGNSGIVSQGSLVIAIGSPLGEVYSILTGNVTASDNEITTIDMSYDIITTDIIGTDISSGALIDLDGKVVGLIMQGYGTESNRNTITALGITEIRGLIEKLSNGKTPVYLGLETSTVTDEIAEEYALPDGIYIKNVYVDSPAMEAGLQTGDVLVKINQQEILSESQYETFLQSAKSGQEIKITVKRMGSDGTYQDVACTAVLRELQ